MGLKKAFICLVVCMMAFPIGSGVSLAEVATRITHKPEGYYIPGFRIKITAQVEDAAPVKEVRCYFKTKEMEDYLFVNMTATAESPNNYEGVLPAPGLGSENLEYYILSQNTSDGVAKSDPFRITEGETPEASEWSTSQRMNLSDDAKGRIQEELEGRIRERYRNDLVKWLQPKGGDSFSVNAENPVTNLRRFSFSDRMSTKMVDAGQRLSHLAVKPVGSASAGGNSSASSGGSSSAATASSGGGIGSVLEAGVLVGGGLYLANDLSKQNSSSSSGSSSSSSSSSSSATSSSSNSVSSCPSQGSLYYTNCNGIIWTDACQNIAYYSINGTHFNFTPSSTSSMDNAVTQSTHYAYSIGCY